MKKYGIIFLLLSFLISSVAYSAPTVGRKIRTKAGRFAKSEGLEMRKIRRVAVGASYGGNLGRFGANLELNFNPEVGFLVGYGGGDGYQAMTFQLKKYLAGDAFLPFISGGYARWFGRESDEGLGASNPNFIAEKFLSASERASGEFELDILYPSVGIQYVNLDGEYAGLSLYAEVLLLFEVSEFQSAPTAAAGMMYYF